MMKMDMTLMKNVRTAVLQGGSPWGISLRGGAELNSPLVISKVEKNSSADGQLLQDDVLVNVNGTEVASRSQAILLIRAAYRTLTLTVLRANCDDPPYPQVKTESAAKIDHCIGKEASTDKSSLLDHFPRSKSIDHHVSSDQHPAVTLRNLPSNTSSTASHGFNQQLTNRPFHVHRPNSTDRFTVQKRPNKRHSDIYRPSLDNLVDNVNKRASRYSDVYRPGLSSNLGGSCDSLDKTNEAVDSKLTSVKSETDISTETSVGTEPHRTSGLGINMTSLRQEQQQDSGTYRALAVQSGIDFKPRVGEGKLWERGDPLEEERRHQQQRRSPRVSVGPVGYRKVEFKPSQTRRMSANYENLKPEDTVVISQSRSSPNLSEKTCDIPPPLPPRDSSSNSTDSIQSTTKTSEIFQNVCHERTPSWTAPNVPHFSGPSPVHTRRHIRQSLQPHIHDMAYERFTRSEEYDRPSSRSESLQYPQQAQYRVSVAKVARAGSGQLNSGTSKMSDAFSAAIKNKDKDIKLMETIENPPSELYPRYDSSGFRYQGNAGINAQTELQQKKKHTNPELNPPSLRELKAKPDQIEAMIDDFESNFENESNNSAAHSRESSGAKSPLKSLGITVVRSPLEKQAPVNLPWPPPPPLSPKETFEKLKIFRSVPKPCYSTSTQTEPGLGLPESQDLSYHDWDTNIKDLQTHIESPDVECDNRFQRSVATGSDSLRNSYAESATKVGHSRTLNEQTTSRRNSMSEKRDQSFKSGVISKPIHANLNVNRRPVSLQTSRNLESNVNESDKLERHHASPTWQQTFPDENLSTTSQVSRKSPSERNKTTLQQIHDYSPSTAPMLRKLSEEFFLQQQNAALRHRHGEHLRRSWQPNILPEESEAGNQSSSVTMSNSADVFQKDIETACNSQDQANIKCKPVQEILPTDQPDSRGSYVNAIHAENIAKELLNSQEQMRFEEIELPWEKSKKTKKDKKSNRTNKIEGEKKKHKTPNPFDILKSFKKSRSGSDSDKSKRSSQEFDYGNMRRTDSEKSLYRKSNDAPPPGKLKRASSETFRPIKERLKSQKQEEQSFNERQFHSPVRVSDKLDVNTDTHHNDSFRSEKRPNSDPMKDIKRVNSPEAGRRQLSDPATSGYESAETLESMRPSSGSSRSTSHQSLDPSFNVLSKKRRSHMDSSSSMRSEDSTGSSGHEQSFSREKLHKAAENEMTRTRKSWDGFFGSDNSSNRYINKGMTLDPSISEENSSDSGKSERPRSLSTSQVLRKQPSPRVQSPGKNYISPREEYRLAMSSPRHSLDSPQDVQYSFKKSLSPTETDIVIKPKVESLVNSNPERQDKNYHPDVSINQVSANTEQPSKPVIKTWETRDNLSVSDEHVVKSQASISPPNSPFADVSKLSQNLDSRFRVEPRSKSSDDVLRVPQLPPRNYSCDEELLSKLQSNSENPAHSSDLNDSYANQLRMQAIKFNPHQTQSTGNARTGQRSRQSPNLIQSKGDSSSMLSIDNFHHNRPLLTSSPVAPSDDDLEYNKNPAESPKLVRTPEKRFKETSFPASPEIPLPPHPSKDNYNCSYIDDDGEPFPSPPLPPGPPPRMSPSFDSNGNKMILNPHSYSSESYMSNRTQRVPFGGFAGNYKRSNSSTFPVSATSVSTHRPGQSHTTDFTPSVTSNDQDNSSKQPYLDGNMDAMDAENEENEITRQPVKAFVANFERPRRFHTPERDSEKPRHPRAQVAALTARFGGSRENLTRSNESLNGSTENVCDKKTLKGSYENTNEDQTAKRQPLVHQKQNGNYHNNYSDSERPGEIISSPSVVTPSRTISVPTTPHTPQSSHNKAPQIIHVRQKSQEEIECEEHAKMLADELKKKDRKLSEVISPPQYHKTTKDYIGDIYNDAESGLSSRRLSLGTPPSRFSIVSRINSEKTPSMSDLSDPPPMSPNWLSPDKTTQQYGSSQAMNKDLESSSLDQKKEELIFRINKKLEILENFQTTLNEDIVENNALETQVSQIVEERCTNHKELEKYHSFVGELDKILQLMLKLSGRLARAENAVLSLPDDADKKEQTLLKSKRDRLQLQLEDARKLKDGIDRREGQVSGFLQKYLSEEEFYDFEHLVKTKSKLTLEQQDLEDKISVGTEQLKALKKSMSHNADMDDLY